MNNKWTKVNKVAVIVSFCVSILGCVLLLVFLLDSSHNFGSSLAFAIAGLVSAVISHIIWAMYIEMSENLARQSSKSTTAMENTLNDISQTLSRILTNMSNGGVTKSDTPWQCACGKVNPADANFCQSCGTVRNNNIPEVKTGGIL